MVLLSFAAYCQSISLIYNGVTQTNNTLVPINGDVNSTLDYIGVKIKNISSGTLNIKMKKVVMDSVPNSTNDFCFFDNCFSSTVWLAPNVLVLTPNAVDSNFSGHYHANGTPGTTTVRYVFFNEANPQDSVCVRVQFNGIMGISEIHRSDITFSDAYPNPANNTTTVSYVLPKQTNTAYITIRNLLGSDVMKINLEDLNGRKTINTSDMKEGIYFYSLTVNNKIYYTRKLIVKH